MTTEVLDSLEHLIESVLLTLATLGMFVFITFLINLFWDGELGLKEYATIASVGGMVVYYLNNALRNVRYEKLEIMADELEDEIEKHEHLRVK